MKKSSQSFVFSKLVYSFPLSIVILIAYINKSLILFLFCVIAMILLYKRWKKLVVWPMIFALLPTISMSMIVKNDGTLNDNECTIIHFESTTFTCSNNIKTIIYTDQLLEIGDRVLVEGKPEKFKNDNFSSTRWQQYYYSKGIYSFYSYPKITILNKNSSIKTIIYNALRNENDVRWSFSKMMLFNYIDDSNKIIYEKIKKIGLAHIIVISSMHLMFFFTFANKILCKFFKKFTASIIVLAVMLIYGYILNFPLSFLKAFIVVACMISFDKKIDKLVVISVSAIAILFYNPLVIYDASYLLTFSMSYFMLLTSNKNKKLMLVQIAIISVLIQIIMSYEIGVFNLMYQSTIGTVLLLSFVFIFWFPGLLDGVVNIIDQAWKNNIYITVGHIDYLQILTTILIVLIISYIFIKYKRITKVSILAFLFIPAIVSYKEFFAEDYITFINVGQADCALISIKGKYYLIDVGGNATNTIGTRKIIPYLKYEGVRVIESIFVSHNDLDHSGSLKDIEYEFNVKKIVRGNKWESLYLNSVEFKQLNTNYVGTENDTSQVIFFAWKNKNFLFLGDVSKSIEEAISYNVKNSIEVIKVAHHGSSSSTSLLAYEKFRPKNSILSYGKNNFGHPNSDVLKTLNQTSENIYHTFLHGALKYSFKTGKIISSNVL